MGCHRLIITVILVTFLLLSMQVNSRTIPTSQENDEDASNEEEVVEAVIDKIIKINKDVNGQLSEGDIKGIAGQLDSKQRRSALRNVFSLWRSRTIPYVLDSSLGSKARDVIAEAIAQFENSTCLKFKEWTDETNYINFFVENGCWSYIGFIGRVKQDISIGAGCEVIGIVEHEIMHALGFFHEQSRYDRDQFVQIMWENIPEDRKRNFEIESRSVSVNLGSAYDYDGLMHYSSYSFTSNRLPTILPLDNNSPVIGQRDGFSTQDLIQINKLYRCDDAPESIWSSWGPYSSCRASGSFCIKDRQKFCFHDLATCNHNTGVISDVMLCDEIACSGNWGSWGSWGACTHTCDTGTRSRTRACDNPPTFDGGLDCAGDAMEIGVCGSWPCNIAAGSIACNFEVGSFCSLTSSVANTGAKTLSFFVRQGETPSPLTGPLVDHTTGTVNGRYVYIEASSTSPGDRGILTSPVLTPGTRCLSFYYFMHGADIGKLTVTLTEPDKEAELFSIEGQQYPAWLLGRANIVSDSKHTVALTASRGKNFRGDISLDDISIIDGACSDGIVSTTPMHTTEPTTTEATTTEAITTEEATTEATTAEVTTTEATTAEATTTEVTTAEATTTEAATTADTTTQATTTVITTAEATTTEVTTTEATTAEATTTEATTAEATTREATTAEATTTEATTAEAATTEAATTADTTTESTTTEIATTEAATTTTPGILTLREIQDLINCSFPNSTCSWTQEASNNVKFHHDQGGYIAINLDSYNSVGNPQLAVISSPTFQTIAEPCCFEFKYRMRGWSQSYLMAKLTSGQNEVTIPYSRNGNQGRYWKTGYFDLDLAAGTDCKISIGAKVFGIRRITAIILDDFALTAGSCSYAEPPKYLRAGFSSDLSYWKQSQTDELDWSIGTSSLSANRKTLYLDQIITAAGDKAVLRSHLIFNEDETCMKFWYSIKKNSGGIIQVQSVITDSGVEQTEVLVEKTAHPTHSKFRWGFVQLPVNINYRILLVGLPSMSGSAIALGRVRTFSGKCPIPLFECDFETDDCGLSAFSNGLCQPRRKLAGRRYVYSLDKTNCNGITADKIDMGIELSIDVPVNGGCLDFFYRTKGPCPLKVVQVKMDNTRKTLFHHAASHLYDRWRRVIKPIKDVNSVTPSTIKVLIMTTIDNSNSWGSSICKYVYLDTIVVKPTICPP